VQGQYYTPETIINEMSGDFHLKKNQTYLDPCCGSGAFLLSISCDNPSGLLGIDIDPIAVMIAKFNLIIKYKDFDFVPNVFCMDFLDKNLDASFGYDYDYDYDYDYILTNPPWGAATIVDKRAFGEISSGESFSYFLVQSLKHLKKGGTLKFLLPKSFMNIKAHKDIRAFILSKYSICSINIYPKLFTGVTTEFVAITIKNCPQKEIVSVYLQGKSFEIFASNFKESKDCLYLMLSQKDLQILNSVFAHNYLTLQKSIWGLGIVTGDNQNKLSDKQNSGWEPIFTGKEISPFQLLSPKKFIFYDRHNLQQVAKDEIYRSPQKLVYKFISKKLVFAYDDTGSLFLNSANILIPNVSGWGIKSILLLLNSELFQFIYMKKFDDIKVLKNNLSQLPFLEITKKQNALFEKLTDAILQNLAPAMSEVQDAIYDFYEITQMQRNYIKETLYGKTKKTITQIN
jgi:hypothetical protein